MSRRRLGFMIPRAVPASRIGALAREVEGAGFDEAWLVEDCFYAGGIAGTTLALAATERLHLGIGILPAVTRNAAFTAMEASALADAFPGRFSLGIGHGMRHWLRQIGVAPASPLTALGEHLDAVRRLLAGEEVTVQGTHVRLDRVRLEFPPRQPPPVLAGVRGPKSLELSGRYADGTILAEPVSPAYLDAARASIARGRGDRDDSRPHPVTAYMQVHVDEDVARAREVMRPVLAAAITDPAWSAHVAPLGITERIEEINRLPESERAAALPDEWVDELTVVGAPADCARRIEALYAAGADSVVVCPIADTEEQLARAAALPALLAG